MKHAVGKNHVEAIIWVGQGFCRANVGLNFHTVMRRQLFCYGDKLRRNIASRYLCPLLGKINARFATAAAEI